MGSCRISSRDRQSSPISRGGASVFRCLWRADALGRANGRLATKLWGKRGFKVHWSNRSFDHATRNRGAG
jgi:hypothetical protein